MQERERERESPDHEGGKTLWSQIRGDIVRTRG